MKNRIFKKYRILLLFLIVKILLQYLVVNPIYELHRDEFLHLDQARHLASGFQSVPPLTSLFSLIIFWLGNSVFWVRFFPALFGAITMVYTWLIAEETGGGILACVTVSLAMLFSVFIRVHILYQPNAFDFLAWTAIFYYLLKYLNSENPKWLYVVSVCIALSLLNKYNSGFLIIGLFPSLLLTLGRKIFFTKHFYISLLLLILLILPNLIWQIENGIPLYHHMEALNHSQLVNNNRFDFVKDQLMYFSGSLPLIVSAFIGLIIYKPFRKYRFIGITYLFVCLIYIILRGKSYYALGLYPVLFSLGSVYLSHILNIGWKRIFMWFIIIFNLLMFIPVIYFVIPRESPESILKNAKGYKDLGLLRWEDGKDHSLPQDFADMLGWREMAVKTQKAYFMIPQNERSETLIIADNYGQAGAVNFYNNGTIPPAYSFNTDYIFWIPELKHIRNIVFIGTKPESDVLKYFHSIQYVGEVENVNSREAGTAIYIFKGANPEFTKWFYEIRNRKIREWDIY